MLIHISVEDGESRPSTVIIHRLFESQDILQAQTNQSILSPTAVVLTLDQ
jgi:hypothetical protein